jgi:eukaryotic-like serine/threonine-protein kinase
MYYSRSANPGRTGIYVRSLDADDARFLLAANSTVAYVEPGYLVYARDRMLLAQPFNADTATTTGDPVPISDGVEQFPEIGGAAFSSSPTGVLAYGRTGDASTRLVWFDRGGKELGAVGDPAPYRNPRLSPDGKRIAVELLDASGNRDIWLMDVARGVPVRFTFDPGRDASPVWSADGTTIAWQGNTRMQAKPSSGAGPELALQKDSWIPDDWLPDGSGLLCHPMQPRQIFILALVGSARTPRLLVEGQRITTHARVSYDGHWVAYANSDLGRFEVYLQRMDRSAGKWLVSSQGGIQPKWRGDGKEIFYVATDGKLMAVPIKLGELPEVGKPQPLFQTRIESTTGTFWHQYDVTRDGQRFLVNTPQAVTTPVTVVVNWLAGRPQTVTRHTTRRASAAI